MFEFLWLKIKVSFNCSSSSHRIKNNNISISCFSKEIDPRTPNVHYISLIDIDPIFRWVFRLTRFPHAHSTDVPLSSFCPPRRWSGAGVGVGMLIGCWGLPYLKIKKVSWLLVLVLASWLQKNMFSKDIWYILSNVHFMIFDRYEIRIQEFRDFIRPIFIISRCPPFRKM